MKDFADTEDLLLQTDILICDWSSIAFDFLALKRPTIFLEVDPPFKNGFSLNPEYRFSGVVTAITELTVTLDQALASPAEFLQRYIQQYDETALAVYGESIDGAASRRQIARLKELVGKI